MAALHLSKPGTEFGPCAKRCIHTDCEAVRETASAACSCCGKRIGYESKFYLRGKVREPIHEACLINLAKARGES